MIDVYMFFGRAYIKMISSEMTVQYERRFALELSILPIETARSRS